MTGLLVAGTTSDAGKSILTTGLCRALVRRGIKVAPYKAQNMSNNSMVCAGDSDDDFREIGRAQWVQAIAAQAVPEAAMNPVLLKPGGDTRSHVVVLGKPGGVLTSGDWVESRHDLAEVAHGAYDDLASRYEVVIAEGAGSPAEINLRAGDYVNMGLARHASLPTIVVGDVDRGGLFAALFGTVALLAPEDQRLIAGFVVNKFRGDVSLLMPGIEELHQLTGRPTYGVLPWHPALWLDSEDALDLDGRRARTGDALRVAVIRFPRISNFTDVDALGLEPGLDVFFATSPRDLIGADLIVLPGTRATIADLAWLRTQGLDVAISEHAASGRAVLGICGGAQMLGAEISDPTGVEGEPGEPVAGLGLIAARTTFLGEKVLRLPTGFGLGQPVSGYEIHHGRFGIEGGEEFPGGVRTGAVFATMWHGSLECDGFRQALLAEVADAVGLTWVSSSVVFAERREARLDLLGDLVSEYLDVEAMLGLALSGVTTELPALAPGSGG